MMGISCIPEGGNLLVWLTSVVWFSSAYGPSVGSGLPSHDRTGQADRSTVLPSAGVVDSAGPDGLPGKDGRRAPEGRAVMDGSALLFILMPIVTIPLLVGWLAMIFYAGNHPQHKTQSAASEVASRNSSADPWSAPLPDSAPAEPARRKGAVPIPLPGPAYSRQSPNIAEPGQAASLRGGAERPAA